MLDFIKSEYGSISSVLGLLISLFILIKSRTIQKEVKRIENHFLLKRRMDGILKELDDRIGVLNKLLVNAEANEREIKENLIKIQSIVTILIPKIQSRELTKNLRVAKKQINKYKKKSFIKQIKSFTWLNKVIYNNVSVGELYTLKDDLDSIYNDLKQISLDQKEL